MQNLRNKIAVVGVGTTKFGRLPDNDSYDLGVMALKSALDDSGMKIGDIDGLIVNRIPDYQRFAEITGINPRVALVTPGQGRMSGATIAAAAGLIAAGQATTIALVYGNNGRSAGATYGGNGDSYGGGGVGPWFPYGMTSPGAAHAIMFQRHAHLYGTRSEQLAAVSVAFRKHAMLNPDAVMQTPITVEDHQRSRFIAEPLHILDYCLINDGGVAIILTAADRARDYAKPPVYIRGFAQATRLKGSSLPPNDFWYEPMQKIAGDIYRMADVKHEDLDALMIYDNFSPTVLFSLEGFGFCKPGESGDFVQGGRLELGGQYPSNTDGGHLSNSYMQGWALNVEAVRQLRGEAGKRQVKDAQLIQYMCAAPVSSSVIYGSEA
ncbi:thiolase family protein [Mesorhizobium sp. 1B3]|uniref:thiolase family protein n=1 Tax=Mesorhizobium sp. 1B3 TaxID=3243599 RepID=UPI003D965C6B